MDVSIVVPVQASDEGSLPACLTGLLAQRYDEGRVDVLVVHFGDGARFLLPVQGPNVRQLAIAHSSPYAARNLAASQSTGDVLLFTEPGCVAEPDWVSAHVACVRRTGIAVGVGHVAPARNTMLVDMFMSYEEVRDDWVFSGDSWQHYFGRPRNMAIVRRCFETAGPFVEVARGADSTLVQKVAREQSCDEVGLVAEAVVRQQSIRGFPSCLRDRFAHGRALRLHKSSHAAPIAFERRVQLFRQTLRRRQYGPLRALLLLLLLGAGVLTFRVGGWAGAIRYWSNATRRTLR